ncbi:MAG: SGNH/GDSL hydrolase family protein [Chitinophagaceae bacterium]
MKQKIILSALTFLFLIRSFSQKPVSYQIWNPSNDITQVLEGQGWKQNSANFYQRLPIKAETIVRKDVWDLSQHTAGLSIRFRSNATEIIIRYMVGGTLQMPHMPATGVSGIDLYSKTIDGNWQWAAGKFSFGDTIVYKFKNLVGYDQHVANREYTLYLPLYNSIKWLEILVPETSIFYPLPVRLEKPIVVYGTSIAQGACASRPGLAWTSILERKLDRPVVNLGFSGNGRLEKEMIDLVSEIDATIYVLDCLPNMVPGTFTPAELKKRIIESIQTLQRRKPGVPILLTDHAGYTEEGTNEIRKKEYQAVNSACQQVFDSLLAKGVKNIYRLSKVEINLNIESMVDGVHPNDLGMMQYAEAYEKKIRQLLKEHSGNSSTTIPIRQRRDASVYDWETRHQEVIAYNSKQSPKIVFIGNSITHFWGGNPNASIVNGANSWKKHFDSMNIVNMGFGWDRIENVLWRIQHGELDGFTPNTIVLMIGTNNLEFNSNDEIVSGLKNLIISIQSKQPAASVLIMGILPRRKFEERIVLLNRAISLMTNRIKVRYGDAGALFLNKEKKIDESLFLDGLHPNNKGYEELAIFIKKYL